jgi:HSF-type DNA-binding
VASQTGFGGRGVTTNTYVSAGLPRLSGCEIINGVPDFLLGMTGLELAQCILEKERQKLQLLQRLSFLSASSQALKSITSLQHQHQAQQLYQAHILERQGLSDAALLAGYASPGLGALPQPGYLELRAPRQTAQDARTVQPVLRIVRSEAEVASGASPDRHWAAAHKTPCRSPEKRVGRSSVFPKTLHRILADLERQGRGDIASFLPHGRAFAIHKPRVLASKVLPKYFRMGHFSSFQRQLNLYDFERITRGEDKVRGIVAPRLPRKNQCVCAFTLLPALFPADPIDRPTKGAYVHPLFVRNRVSLSLMMKRVKIKGAAVVRGIPGTSASSSTRTTTDHSDNAEGVSSSSVETMTDSPDELK